MILSIYIVHPAIMSGAHEDELTALKYSDVDSVNNRVTIERADYKLKDEPVMTKPPKDKNVS